jgi:hypothetical protein
LAPCFPGGHGSSHLHHNTRDCRYLKQCCGSRSGIRCLFGPWIRDPGWVRNQDTDPASGSGMNIPDHISGSLETFLWVKNTQILLCGSGIRNFFDPGSGMEKFGSGIRIRNIDHKFTFLNCTGKLQWFRLALAPANRTSISP